MENFCATGQRLVKKKKSVLSVKWRKSNSAARF